MLKREELTDHLQQLLQPALIHDYCPNGLQVEGKSTIQKIVTGVSANQALIEAAIVAKADALIVHHGFFWKSERPEIVGIKHHRLLKLLENNINLYAYHLPLDVHAEYGNNIQLARVLELDVLKRIDADNIPELVCIGRLKQPMSVEHFITHLSDRLQRTPFVIPGEREQLQKIAWCTGGAQNYFEYALDQDVDAYLTGEISEPVVHIARETGLHYFAAGHHATERYGVQALGEHLSKHFNLECQFIDIDNPV